MARKPAKPHAKPKTIGAYLARVPGPARGTLRKMRAAIRAAAPGATETISYGIPAFRYKKSLLVWFAAFQNHCSLFPKVSVIKALRSDLRKYKVSKGTIQFPVNKPLPAALIRKIVKLRVAEIENKNG